MTPFASVSHQPGRFIISLDFELLWGVRDHADRKAYGANVLGARDAVVRMLDMFAVSGISATWATVGFLFCHSKDELLSILPKVRPSYRNAALSSYSYLGEVGQNERTDPFYFAPSLIERIQKTPKQEIATHTLSHFYCLENGSELDAFEADLLCAQWLAADRGIEISSIVFPRNQFSLSHLEVCHRVGLICYRGNPSSWAYHATHSGKKNLTRRGLRLVDAYSGVLGPHATKNPVNGVYQNQNGLLVNAPASRFLRPCAGKLSAFYGQHIAVIKREMTHAAMMGLDYHLWWHPHNFGQHLEENLSGLNTILNHFNFLNDQFGMKSVSMCGEHMSSN